MNEIRIKHETHQHVWIKFLLVIILFVSYFVFVSMQYGVNNGFLITWLTWSFFVLCTPIADAGFLIDFPMRLLLNVRMLISEMFVRGCAILLNIYVYFFNTEMYSKTKILSLFKHIIDHPIPFWIIILLSGFGTFLSVKFGDELLDIKKYKDREYSKKHHVKWQMILMVSTFVIILIVYDFLLKKLGVNIPL